MNAKDFKQKITSPLLWGNLLAMVLVVVALVLGVRWWLQLYTHHGQGIEVPDLYGMDYATARERLADKDLVLIVNDSAYDKRLSAGSIMVQQPVKGARVKQGRIIYVTINSLTLSRVAIPDLVDNSSYREAQAKLQSLGFRVGPPRLIEGEKDWVYGIQHEGHNLITGDMVAQESTLTLVIGSGFSDDYMEDSLMVTPFMSTETEEGDEVDTFLEVADEDEMQ